MNSQLKTGLILTIILLLISVYSKSQTRYYVKAEAFNYLGNGLSWESAFKSLQTALSNSQAGDEIWVAKGTYYPTTNSDRTIAFEIPDSVKVYGGFDGTELYSYNINQRDFSKNISQLSGDIGNSNYLLDNSYHIIKTENVSKETIIDGFNILKGYANSTNSDQQFNAGAGLYNIGTAIESPSSPILKNLIFEENYGKDGGAIYNDYHTKMTIQDCTFKNNSASRGGAIQIRNTINSQKVGKSETKISRSRFENNSVSINGGAIYFHCGNGDCSPVLENCFFINNIAEIQNSSITPLGGAVAIYSSQGTSNITINNSLFAENHAYYGGALSFDSNYGSHISNIQNTTFYHNSADRSGKVLSNRGYNGSSKSFIKNCILEESTNPSIKHFDNFYSETTLSFSIVNTSNCDLLGLGTTCQNTTIFNGAPEFIDSNNIYGNDNIIGTSDDGLMLSNTSEAIDEGSKVNLTYFSDIIGQKHINAPDIGAYENPCSKIEFLASIPDISNEYAPYATTQTLTAANTITAARVYYQAGKHILLNPGFKVEGGHSFQAKIDNGCL
ncbi:3-coathanger stack domain-containing protein [Arcticibacterium luteifluviistationis]|uniref:Right handed beta helix domain-containing protein n=1 Tax=Arcticibacterium luteifluviistationis TaxID=1784714 RepID=A0A2Z4GAW3_9BACT|nr:3-coathanger stack domain-containing protein [Arcticibacterium luteifluviistationis]AWV98284.1 hypothetical protein DJ013_08920 [Arcticibacterium luteifluviistationis]